MERPKHAKYFEGVLQLRNPTPEIMGFFRSQMNKKPEVFISNVERLKNGMDISLSSKKYLQQIGKKLQETFGGELKISAEHFSRSRQTSKDMFRVNVMYRYHGVRKGDVITVRGDEVKIIQISRKLHVINISTGRKYFLDFDELPVN